MSSELPLPACPGCGGAGKRYDYEDRPGKRKTGVSWPCGAYLPDGGEPQAVGAARSCRIMAELRRSLHRCWAELATEDERNHPLPEPLRDAMRDAWEALGRPGAT